jgi:hypothetical protein
MELQRTGWLPDLLGRILAGYSAEQAWLRLPAASRGQGAGAGLGAAARARAHVEAELRRTGLLFGSPKLPGRVTQGRRFDRAESLFFGVIAGKCFLALDVARIFGVSHETQRAEAELTMFLAAAAGRADLAEELAWRLPLGEADEVLDRVQERLERALEEKSAPASGDALFDLPLHNGVVFGEARVVGRLARAWYGEGRFDPREAGRLLAAVDRERASLIEALLVLAWYRSSLSEQQVKLMRRELRRMRLPSALAQRVRASIDKPPSAAELAKVLRTRSLRRFALEQVYLAGLLAGTEDEPMFGALGEAFGWSAEELRAIEAEVADYFYDPADVFDAFEIRAAGQEASAKLVDRIAREVSLNMDRVALEVRETGELAQLLAKSAMGQKLTAEERSKAREQLLDLAKVVPSLAIIAAPGGMLIFAALLKVLPFSLLPSAFQKRPEPPARRRLRR